ncbi:hypothetical protein [Streptomyces sp. CBMA152]|uniref:hypothetical protein n=1 Tax=Streptomyces sp. CBMA152 TaxID=1896312 RepID=UPI00166120E4|nr:hypothetical protein [Streptomyces sp. CBMA152]MBD0742004.1 hypothetical protein [Streptomyces sp. CBMA152]
MTSTTTPARRPRQVPPRHRRRVLTALAGALALATLTTGCSMDSDSNGSDPGGLGYTPTTLAVDEARAKTKRLSSQIYDLLAIKNAQTTRPGPGITRSTKDPDHLYQVRHPWSLYDVPVSELQAGYQRLKDRMPGNGWKITKSGPNGTKANTQELYADSTAEDRFTVLVELWDKPTAGKKPLILVTVVSAYFRAPQGTDLDGEY